MVALKGNDRSKMYDIAVRIKVEMVVLSTGPAVVL